MELADKAYNIISERGTINRNELKKLLGVNHNTFICLVQTMSTLTTIYESDDGELGLLNDNRAPYDTFGFCCTTKKSKNTGRPSKRDYFCRGSLSVELGSMLRGMIGKGIGKKQ